MRGVGHADERGAAVVDFVLVLVVLVPLLLGVLQVGLVLHVRNTLMAAASEGARYAATVDRPADGRRRARPRSQIRGALADRFARAGHRAGRASSTASRACGSTSAPRCRRSGSGVRRCGSTSPVTPSRRSLP